MDELDTSVTITNCKQDPVHFIGHIQAHKVVVICRVNYF